MKRRPAQSLTRSSLPKTAVIIPAAGSGERLGANLPKALVQLVGRPLISHAVAAVSPVASQIIIAAPAGYEKNLTDLFGDSVTVVTGGSTRSASVKLALSALETDIELVLVHDAARCLASTDLASRVIAELLAGEKAVIPATLVTDTIKKVDKKGYVAKTYDREKLRAVQTPQGFVRSVLEKAHASGGDATDDAGLVEELGIAVKVIAGEDRAQKITTQQDLADAHRFLVPSEAADIRAGVGTDAHAFSADPSRPMWLAGLLWPDVVGVDGHSDGDVAAHAICDALFAAASLGDLGSNFGTSDPKYAGASGETLLRETHQRLRLAGFSIMNVSVQIVGNKPKLSAHREEARAALSEALGGAVVSVSATTTDGLGFTGEGKGISAIATALIVRR
jgi:2-C-methyl-D-erythritol 4-phosphate cytidylyltransferase / 2-C-methyl-D-erythritol 2,4-cyclodiphosphate synthase